MYRSRFSGARGEAVTSSPTELLTGVQGALEEHDPDVLICLTSEIVPSRYEMATDPDVDDEDREELQTFATEITEHVEIRLEHETHYDWVAFVPQCESEAGALTKYLGTVPIDQLVERNRVSKPLEGYTQNTQNVVALKRAREQNLAVHPGQDIGYVVVADEKAS